MFFRHEPDRYSTEPLHKIFKDESKDCFFKRISENETLLAKKLRTHNPEVWKITRSHKIITFVLMPNQYETHYNWSLVSGSEKQEFLDELFNKLKNQDQQQSLSAQLRDYQLC